MEQLSPLDKPRQIPFLIKLEPFLFDHCIKIGAVLPAVQTMRLLADLVAIQFPSVNVRTIHHASFDKLLLLPTGEQQLNTFCEVAGLGNNTMQIRLLSKTRSKSGITRNLQHACLEFGPMNQDLISNDWEPFPEFEHAIPVQEIYPGLVIFGKIFQNITQPVRVNRQGASTAVKGGELVPGPEVLGSPFPLDAAFHAACAWGRHYHQRICYPVGFEKRIVHRPTQPGQEYDTLIKFIRELNGELEFDLLLSDETGATCESVTGLRMKEIGAGLA